MKSDIVCQTVVTNSDNSFDTFVASDSRDEDDESQDSGAIDERDQADASIVGRQAMLGKTSAFDVDDRPNSTQYVDEHCGSALQQAVPIPPDQLVQSDAEVPVRRSAYVVEDFFPMTPAHSRPDDNQPTAFLRRSPTASFGTPPAKKRDDASSFSLFGHSFDSVSHTTDLGNAFPLSPMPRIDRFNIDISLPTLSHEEEHISPIKIDLVHHKSAHVDKIAYRYQEIDYQQDPPEHYRGNPSPAEPTLRPYGYDEYRYDNAHAYSNPIFVLRSCRNAFRECTFILSHVQVPNPLSVHCSTAGSFHHYHNSGNTQSEYYDPHDLVIAYRRVNAAVCAFGGSLLVTSQRGRASIFRGVDHWNSQYEMRLHKRYDLSGSQISWDHEEHPPIYIDPKDSIQKDQTSDLDDLHHSPEGSIQRDGAPITTPSPSSECPDDQPKIKYRCKLCGQPKQNHNCPFRHAMQRNIGVSVYPVVNAYTASEPGNLAPALADMNNFIDRSDEGFPIDIRRPMQHSPHSSEMTPPCSGFGPCDTRKRKHSELSDSESFVRQVSPFAQSESLYREQFRAVSVPTKEGDFEYPSLPLSFHERKQLSDTLFALSKEIRHLPDEVASILHDARERDLWDVAVAQVMTQVIVALYCSEGDKRLDGLHHYLLGIGISS